MQVMVQVSQMLTLISFFASLMLTGAYYMPMVGVNFFWSMGLPTRKLRKDVFPTLQLPTSMTVCVCVYLDSRDFHYSLS